LLKVQFQRSFFCNQKCFIITGERLGYLTAFLNSKLFKFAFKEYFPELLGDTRELSKIFFETVPVKPIDNPTENYFKELTNQIQDLKKVGKDTKNLELEIESQLGILYSLSDDDMDIINSKVIDVH
jgi:hypothetical protein